MHLPHFDCSENSIGGDFHLELKELISGLSNNWKRRVPPKLAKPMPAKLTAIPMLPTIMPLATAATPPDKIGCFKAPVMICSFFCYYYSAYFYWILFSRAKSA